MIIGKEIYHDFFISKLSLNSEAVLQDASTNKETSNNILAAILIFVS